MLFVKVNTKQSDFTLFTLIREYDNSAVVLLEYTRITTHIYNYCKTCNTFLRTLFHVQVHLYRYPRTIHPEEKKILHGKLLWKYARYMALMSVM